ncbi:MAG: hypothetical protein LBD41_02090 [Clostridiales Family XIII bacterium]|jgi:hypothetical protein|nr:hypothetical protein [Clostridiales Family XIII bacterium]
MAEGVSGVPNSAIFPTANKITCIYCAELDLKLLQAKTEITSLEKTIKLLQEELNMKRTPSNHEFEVMVDGSVVSLTQQTEADLEGDNNWTKVMQKEFKRRPEDKLESTNPKEQTAIRNHYEALALDSTKSGKKNDMRIIYKNKLKVKNNIQTSAQYNLQNSRVSHQETNIKTGMETYTIPSIINGRPSREDVSL